MNLKDYKKLVKSNSKKENIILNLFISFITGGLMGILGVLILKVLTSLGLSISDSSMYLMIVIVVISSILTGLGFFDKVVSFCKCGLIVPSTGFAHAMTSSAMDNKSEGLIKGIGSNMFKLTGSIILYGLLSAFLFSLIKGVIL